MPGDWERTKGLNKTLTKIQELTVTKQDRTHGFKRKNIKQTKQLEAFLNARKLREGIFHSFLQLSPYTERKQMLEALLKCIPLEVCSHFICDFSDTL